MISSRKTFYVGSDHCDAIEIVFFVHTDYLGIGGRRRRVDALIRRRMAMGQG